MYKIISIIILFFILYSHGYADNRYNKIARSKLDSNIIYVVTTSKCSSLINLEHKPLREAYIAHIKTGDIFRGCSMEYTATIEFNVKHPREDRYFQFIVPLEYFRNEDLI